MATHQDAFAEQLRYAKQQRVNEFRSFNSDATNDDVTISHPSAERREIELQKPLLAAMAQENRAKVELDGPFGDGSVEKMFDESLCEVTELSLQMADVGDSQIALYKLRALLIRYARNLNSYKELAEYVSGYSTDELKQFGLHPARGGSTYRKAAKQLKEDGSFESLKEASHIAVHAIWWNGVPIPKTVIDLYSLSYDDGPAASEYSNGARQLVFYNLVDELLQIVEQHLTLQRDSNKSRALKSLIGAFAYAAHHEESVGNYSQTAQHAFDLSSALSGSTITQHIDSLMLWEIEEMFQEINKALLEYVIESGVVSKPAMVSFDLTDVQSLDLEDYDGFFRTEDGRWRFASLSFTDPDIEFAFGLRLLKSESQRARILKNFLRDLTDMVDVELLMMDRGFDGREDIEACQKFVKGNWAVCAQDDSKPLGGSSDYAHLRAKLQPGETAVQENAGFNNLKKPVQLIGYSGAGSDADTPDPIRAFFTDMELPDDEEEQRELITTINFQYNHRSKIEVLFSMVKNRFDVATDTDQPRRKTFYFNLSVLFYNLYQIVNMVPTPKHGLELNTTQNELLEVVHNLALEGPTPPDALTYHREHR